MTHHIIHAVGTAAVNIARSALAQVHARGGTDCASGVFAAADDPGELGLTGMDGVRWHPYPDMRDVVRSVADYPEQYPWIPREAIPAMRRLGALDGKGFGGMPGFGRCGYAQVAPDLFNSLRDLHDQAISRGDDVVVDIVTTTFGGTSRGSILEAGLLAKRACREVKVRRNIVVLPSFAIDAPEHLHRKRAQNALSALQIVDEGMTESTRWFAGPNGREEILATLADDVVLFAPAYQADPHATIKALTNQADINVAAARLVAGLAGGERAWQVVRNEGIDTSEERIAPQPRWVGAANEGRIYFDQARLLACAMAALLA